MKTLTRFFKEEDGVTAIEYGLIAALIAVAIIGAVELLGGNLSSTFNTVAEQFPVGDGGGEVPPPPAP